MFRWDEIGGRGPIGELAVPERRPRPSGIGDSLQFARRKYSYISFSHHTSVDSATYSQVTHNLLRTLVKIRAVLFTYTSSCTLQKS
jgi:hypothetical protein